MNKNLKYLIKVVKKASRLITNNLIVDSKDENNDLITNFDLKIETFISKKLLKKYPDFKIIGLFISLTHMINCIVLCY